MTQQEATFILSLYETYSKGMRAQMLRSFGDPDLADDLVIATFLTAMVKVKELMAHPDPERWLYRTLLYKGKHELRRFARHMENYSTEQVGAMPSLDDTGLTELLPQGLSQRDKQLLIWRFEEQQDFDYIARQLGISKMAAQKGVSRAVERCRRFLTPPSNDTDQNNADDFT